MTFSSSLPLSHIDAALSRTGPSSLSYVHQELKWIIRDHILSLLKEFTTLSAYSDDFIHEDGARVHLLCLHGGLPLACSHGSLDITIWLHQSHPFVPPMVYLSSASSTEIDWSNPLLNASTRTASIPYLMTWEYPKSNLLDLARNMVTLFTLWPPFCGVDSSSSTEWVSPGSKREAIDRLYVVLRRNLAFFEAQTEKEIESLWGIQEKLRKRRADLQFAVKGLVKEKESLRGLVKKVEGRADILRTWLWATSSVPPAASEEELFQVMDMKSEFLLKTEVEILAIEDVLFSLDEALRRGVLEFREYIPQVRKLCREQFFHVALQKKLHQRLSRKP